MKKTISEHAEQVALFKWASLNTGNYPCLENLFAIPNGGQRSEVTGKMLKAEGVRSGVPDIFLAYPSNGYHGLFIEMKRRKGWTGNHTSTVSLNQSHWLRLLNGANYMAVVCFGASEAKEVILEYIETP